MIQQNPHPGAHVKENRTIFFTINARMPEKVMMPDLRGATLRLASSRLSAFGLRQGRLEYRNDMAVNSVLSQRYLGREIAPGTRVPKGPPLIWWWERDCLQRWFLCLLWRAFPLLRPGIHLR